MLITAGGRLKDDFGGRHIRVRGNAANQKDCCKEGGRNHLDAEIRVSSVIRLYFEISFARGSTCN